jgi:large subunit ribosomal protein L30
MSEKTIAVVRVRSSLRMSADEEFALRVLHLNVPNACVFVKDTPEKLGMIHKMAGVLTWGEATPETLELVRKHKKSKGNEFRLNPPRKGYSHKGAKLPFAHGGALGDRGVKINDLIKRMVE